VAGGKEKGRLKLLGQVIGIGVMILALLAGACSITKCGKYGYGKKTCCAKAAGLSQCPLSGSKRSTS